MDKVGVLFWRRFAIVLAMSIMIGFIVGSYFSWIHGLVTYVSLQWFTFPVLFRMSMND